MSRRVVYHLKNTYINESSASLIPAQEYDWQNNHIGIGECIMLTEQWKPIEGTDERYKYEISNRGNIRKQFKLCTDAYGYKITTLKIDNETKQRKLHQLVWQYFGGSDIGDGYIIDHIDNNPANNNIDNLQPLTHRENITKCWLAKGGKTSKWVGVRWNGHNWEAHIRLGMAKKRIGSFNCETAAHFAYLKTLKDNNINNRMA